MKKVIILSVFLLVFSLFVSSDQTNPTSSEPKYYENAKVIRVKYSSGEAFVQRSYDEGFEQATVNLPIFEKDKAGTTSGRLEFYLGRSNYLRLDFDTEMIFTEIPTLRTTNANLRIIKGGIYLDIDNLDAEKDIEIQTPDCGVFLLDRGIVRINVNEAGFTEVYILEGTAEVAGDNTSRIVRANQKAVMASGDFRERPFYFQASDRDGFDQWNEERNRAIGYARHSASRYLESGYEDYEYELSHSGRWAYEPSYSSYIWIPYNIAATWRPYWHGRWIWHPFYGYVWNSYDSWGWFTHYYGRWHWSHHHGWYWLPGYHWSPAWVSWFWNDYYYGWCPLSYWNRPLIVLNKRWLRNYHYRKGIPLRSRSNIIIRKNQLSSSHIHKVALKGSSIAKIPNGNLTFRGSAPRGQLKHSFVNLTDARGRQLGFKKGGIISGGKSNSGRIRTSGSQQQIFKYSGKQKTAQKPFKSRKSTLKSRTPYRKQPVKSYRSQRSSSNRSYKSYRSNRKTSGRTGKSYRRSSTATKRRSSSGKRSSTRKKSQPYFSSRFSRSTLSRTTTAPNYSSNRESHTSGNSRSATRYYSSLTRNRSYPAGSSNMNNPSYRSRTIQPSHSSRTYSSNKYRSGYQSSRRSTSRSTRQYPSRNYHSNRSQSHSSSRSLARPRRSSSSKSYSRSQSSSRSSSSSSGRRKR